MKIRNKEEIRRILFITLSNIGDIVLTMPALSVLKREFPGASIDALSGPNGGEIFSGHPYVSRFMIYDKFSKTRFKIELINRLKKNRYDLIVDLRNSLLPLLIGSRYRTPVIRFFGRGSAHKRDEHLNRLKGLGLDVRDAPFAFHVNDKDTGYVKALLADGGIKKRFVAISPGAKSRIKRWTKEAFASVCDRLIGELGLDVAMIGDKQDADIVSEIKRLMKNRALDLSDKLTLRQLGALIKLSSLVITNDSAPMHISHAVGMTVLAIFGPTDPRKYGPRGGEDVIIRKEIDCSPCEAAQCKKNHECMKLISADEVFEAAKRMLK